MSINAFDRAIIRFDKNTKLTFDQQAIDHARSARVNWTTAKVNVKEGFSFAATRDLYAMTSKRKMKEKGVARFFFLAIGPGIDLLRMCLKVSSGVKNAADSAMHGALAGLRRR